MKQRLHVLLQSYPLWVTLTLLPTVGAAAAWLYHIYMAAIPLTLFALYALRRQIRLHRQYARKVLFLLDAIGNDDYSVRFSESGLPETDRLVHRALNRMTQILGQAKNETVQREKYYELILNCVNTGIVVLNDRGDVCQKNNEVLRLLGMEILTHVDQLARVDARLPELLARCRPGDKLQTTFTNERGTANLSIRVSGITIRGEALRIVALNDINHELDEKEIDSWMRLTRVLTHEIMNSVTPITSLSDTLLTRMDEKDELRQGLQTISNTGKGLLAFVENYRRFTHIPTPVPTLFYVKGFIQRMVQLARHRFPDTQADFRIDIRPDDLILHADEHLVAQVMTNLLTNALQALGTRTDGRISIRAYCDESEAVLIEVANNGPAIPPEVAAHIFIPFFTTKENGSGIGLSISRQIMRLSGGSLAYLPGKETMFVLKFD